MANEGAVRAPRRATLGFVAEAQERLGALPVQVTMREAWLGHARIGEGERVLEVGCGTGVVTRDLARLVGPFGTVVAVDPSEALLRVAARLAAEAGIESRIDLRLGDALALDLPPQSVDHAVISMVLAHLPDPRVALGEVRRVLRPGAGLAVFEQDLESFAVDHPERGTTRVILQHAFEHYLLHPDSARRTPGLLAELGFEDVQVLTFLQAERGEDGFLFDLCRRFAELAMAQGRIRPENAHRWVEILERKVEDGTFFASLPHYAVLGRRPPFGG